MDVESTHPAVKLQGPQLLRTGVAPQSVLLLHTTVHSWNRQPDTASRAGGHQLTGALQQMAQIAASVAPAGRQ